MSCYYAASVSPASVLVGLQLTQRSMAGLVKVKCCGLCGLEFEELNLPGVVSFQAIANLRKKWGSALPEDTAKLRSGQ